MSSSNLATGRGTPRPGYLIQSSLAVACVAIGIGLIIWSLASPVPSPEVPFSIKPTDAVERLLKGPTPKLPDSVGTKSFEVRVEGVSSPIAEFVTLERKEGLRAILAWSNKTPEPIFSPDVESSDVVKIAEAISKHTKPDDLLVGFPGLVAPVAVLSNRKMLIDTGAPLSALVPPMWQKHRSAIVDQQRDFWHTGADDAAMLDKIAEALLSDELTGTAILAALSKGKRSFLVLHIGDVMRLGAIKPERFSVGYRDFPGGSRSHGLIKSVKGWLQENGHSSYAVEQRDGDYSRVYFLGEDKLQTSLIARALPFSTSNPMKLDVLKLVYQVGGAWVFRIDPLGPSSAN